MTRFKSLKENKTDPRDNPSFRLEHFSALIICMIFVGMVSFSIFYPLPSGPPDNGDFNRIFSSFSSGPLGHEFWPNHEDQEAYQKRFYNFYHRFWRLDGGRKEFAHFSSSRLFFWPGRLINLTTGVFDLTWNAFLVTLFVGYALYLSIRKIKGSWAILSLGLVAFLFADANISGYLNSFYQESGAFVSFLLLICALHGFWTRRNMSSLILILVFSLILAGTKVAYTPSVLPAILPILAGIMLCSTEDFPLRRHVIIVIILVTVTSVLFMKFLTVVPGNERRANCYHFIFTGVMPLLSPEEGRSFLHSLALDPDLIRLGGKNAYQPDSEFNTETLRTGLTPRLHLKAVFRFVFDQPREFLKMSQFGLSQTGFYPNLRSPSLFDSIRVTSWFNWWWWSSLHYRWLHGVSYYVLVFGLGVILGGWVWKRREFGWPLFYFLGAAGFFPASVIQILISILGNGPADIMKHMYFANLLLDGAFIFVICGLIVNVKILWKEKGASARKAQR